MSDAAVKSGLAEKVAEDFGAEWDAFDQTELSPTEHQELFEKYFSIFSFEGLENAEGFDLGCGSGRWSFLVAPRVGKLHCIDPAAQALAVARRRLQHFDNVETHLAGASEIPLADGSQDFGFALGVLHHTENPEEGLRASVEKLKPNGQFLLYLYYRFDQRPAWFRVVWRVSDILRRGVSRLPFALKKTVTDTIATLVYLPLARSARWWEKRGANVEGFPLSAYRLQSFYTMRTDSLDRFGTKLEHRYTRTEIQDMMKRCGLGDINFSEESPYWVACGRRIR